MRKKTILKASLTAWLRLSQACILKKLKLAFDVNYESYSLVDDNYQDGVKIAWDLHMKPDLSRKNPLV